MMLPVLLSIIIAAFLVWIAGFGVVALMMAVGVWVALALAGCALVLLPIFIIGQRADGEGFDL